MAVKKDENYRALHAMNLPVMTIAGSDAERPGEHMVKENKKAPGEVITVDELIEAGQTEDDILRLTTEHLPADSATEGIAMCLESQYADLLEQAKAKTEVDNRANVLRGMGLTDDQIKTVLSMEPDNEAPATIEYEETEGGEVS